MCVKMLEKGIIDKMQSHLHYKTFSNLSKNEITNSYSFFQEIPRGLMARILGFHPRGPGSIPGVGEINFIFFTSLFPIYILSFLLDLSWPIDRAV